MYTCHGEDASFVATNVFKTSSVIKHFAGTSSEKGLSYVELTRLAAEGLMRDMLMSKQCKIEVYGQDKGKGHSTWKIVRRGSPGNLQDFEDLLFANTDIHAIPMLLAVKLVMQGEDRVSLALICAFAAVKADARSGSRSLGLRMLTRPIARLGSPSSLTMISLVISRYPYSRA